MRPSPLSLATLPLSQKEIPTSRGSTPASRSITPTSNRRPMATPAPKATRSSLPVLSHQWEGCLGCFGIIWRSEPPQGTAVLSTSALGHFPRSSIVLNLGHPGPEVLTNSFGVWTCCRSMPSNFGLLLLCGINIKVLQCVINQARRGRAKQSSTHGFVVLLLLSLC